MNVRYRDEMQHLTREELQEMYPELSERVFKLLKDITPSIAAFEIERRGGFNMQALDRGSHQMLLSFMKQHFNEGAYDVFTDDDTEMIYERFRYMYYTSLMVRQGIYKEGTDEGGVFWERVVPPKPKPRPIRQVFRARDIYTNMWMG